MGLCRSITVVAASTGRWQPDEFERRRRRRRFIGPRIESVGSGTGRAVAVFIDGHRAHHSESEGLAVPADGVGTEQFGHVVYLTDGNQRDESAHGSNDAAVF